MMIVMMVIDDDRSWFSKHVSLCLQRHNNVDWALCPFCLEGFRMSPAGPEGPSWGSTMKYFSHLMIHKSRKRHKCQQCRLSFVLGNVRSFVCASFCFLSLSLSLALSLSLFFPLSLFLSLRTLFLSYCAGYEQTGLEWEFPKLPVVKDALSLYLSWDLEGASGPAQSLRVAK